MSGGNTVSSSPFGMVRPIAGNFGDCLELTHNLFKDTKRNISHNFDHHMGTENTAKSWRAPDQDAAVISKLYGQAALLSSDAKRVSLNGGYYSSNSLSDTFNKKLMLSSDDVFVAQSVNTTQSNFGEGEVFESLEEIEAQTIGDLLPDDDDLLSGAIHNLGYVAHSNRADVEDDLFCSVGGMELESDDNYGCNKASEYDYGGAFNCQVRGLDNLPASEITRGQQPTRTLFVKNLDGNINDMEVRAFFEQYGDIWTLYTSCRHHGFIMVSYYDIRAAQNARRVLHTKSIRGEKLDVQFCLSKDNPSEKDVNAGMLLVTNLEPSISNDDLLHLFGIYGELKEIREIPHQWHYKLIEFYDVRAAEAALSALNMRDIAGRRIKVEPCGLIGTRFSSVQQLSVDMEDEESNRCFVPSGLSILQTNTSSGLHNGAIQGMHTAFDMQNSLSMVGNHGNKSGNSELSHSLGRMNLGFQTMSHFPEFCDGAISGIPFNSPSSMSAMAMNISPTLANGVDNRSIHCVGSGGHGSHSFEHNEAAINDFGNGSRPLHGHEYIWNNSNAYHHHHPSSIMLQNLPPFVNNISAPTLQRHVLPRGPYHVPKFVLSPSQHIGSAPAVDPLLCDRRHSFTGDATAFHPSSVGSIGYSSCSPLNSLEVPSHNIFPYAAGTCLDPSIGSVHVGVTSPQQRSHMFRGRNHANPMSNSPDTPNDRIRSRMSDSSANQADSRKQYELDIERIIRGEDSRTTLMIKNIPNKYTSKMLMATIDEQHKGTYDFIYLPIDFKNKCNVGYAFINMTDPQHIVSFYQTFNGKKWEKFNSEKVAYLAYARIQGKSALVAHFQNSSLMNEDKRCRPILFHSDGPNAGANTKANLRSKGDQRSFVRNRDPNQIESMKATEVRTRAPGKIILSGEHAVVHGSAAVAAAIDLYTHVHCQVLPFSGSMIMFKSGALTRIKSSTLVKMLITNTKVGRNTKALVAGVSERASRHPGAMASVFTAVDYISKEMSTIIESPALDDLSVTAKEEKIGELMEMNHGLLQCMGVTHASIETVLRTTLKYKLASKLTGAGGGGCVLTLLPTLLSSTVVSKVVDELESCGFQCMKAQVGGKGLEICYS